ncbi:MAG: hypothetical protein FJX74_20375 [Armatimonadetes bacterium]|nr:hypothetical protein [Armatimonadota bacterium]
MRLGVLARVLVAGSAVLLTCLSLSVPPGTPSAVPQDDGPSIETILRGIEARADGLSFRGRFVQAELHNKRRVELQKRFEPAHTDVLSLRQGFTDGVLDLSLADAAYDQTGTRWRYEKGAVALSGMPLLEWLVTGPYPYFAREVYRSSVSDGDSVREYYRPCNTFNIRPLEGYNDIFGIQQLRWEMLRTMPYHMPFSMTFRNTEEAAVRYCGVDTADSIECQVWACAGLHTPPRGYARMWVAPQLDFAIVRDEQVRLTAQGKPNSCIVIRRWDWDVAEGAPLHVPRKVQVDQYFIEGTSPTAPKGEGEFGWWQSWLLAVDELELSDQPLAAEDLDVSVPFDAHVYDVGQESYRPRISWNPDRLIEVLGEFRVPDQLGERLKTEDAEEVMLGG